MELNVTDFPITLKHSCSELLLNESCEPPSPLLALVKRNRDIGVSNIRLRLILRALTLVGHLIVVYKY